MKKIGLNAESLFIRGVAEQSATSGKLVNKVFQNKNLLNDPKQLQAELTVAREEALIKAVAIMIEENNDALLNDLKKVGVVVDQK